MIMNDFTVNEMLTMQKELQEKYKDKWEDIAPEKGKNKLLWMICEIGEVIDIIKKKGNMLWNNIRRVKENLYRKI